MKELQNFVGNFGLGISKEKLASKAYGEMERAGHDVCILNGRYLIVDGVNYQFIKSQKAGSWIVKSF